MSTDKQPLASRRKTLEGMVKHVPYPGMIDAFEAHFSQDWYDPDWRRETQVWAAAWKAAKRTQI